MEKERKFLVLVGRRASGKGVFQEVASSLGIPCHEMSSVVFSWMKREGIEVNNRNTAEFSLRIRKEHGQDVVARKLVEEIRERGLVIISGARSKEEILFFRSVAPTLVLEIRADERKRFERLSNRQRAQDPKSWEEFVERERAEDALGISEALALADVCIENNRSEREFIERSKRFLLFSS